MEPLSTSPQPLDSMAPTLFILSFVLLGAFMVLGKVINWLLKRSLVNAAAIFFWLVLVFVVSFTVYSFVDERITLRGHRLIGQATGALIPCLVLAFFLGRRFKKKSREAVARQPAEG
jgi:UDP-N-acetylmuramyl pentapeptide phosphotransferase/UDP-N-acetylglucosamine-1-phosphate transferase